MKVVVISLVCIALLSVADAGLTGEAIIYFNCNDFIKVPRMVYGDNLTYPLDLLPVYTENQTIDITFEATNTSEVSLRISRLDASKMLRFVENGSEVRFEIGAPQNLSNAAGDLHLNSLTSGVYLVSVLDNRSSIISSVPMLVVKSNLTLDIPENVTAGDFLNVGVFLDGLGNVSKIFGVCMLSISDYECMKLIPGNDGLNVSFRNRSASLPLVKPSIPALMEMLDVLPEDGAVGMQESNETKADVLLMTSPESESGTFIVTAAVYAPGRGLIGLRQGRIEVLPAAP